MGSAGVSSVGGDSLNIPDDFSCSTEKEGLPKPSESSACYRIKPSIWRLVRLMETHGYAPARDMIKTSRW